MKRPRLDITPQLSNEYTRDQWINDAFEKNRSESARESNKNIIARCDHYTQKIHGMRSEDVFDWMKKESKDQETLTQYAIDFLSKYVKFCQQEHPDIIINKGRKPKKGGTKINKSNYLKKLHNNSIPIYLSRTRQFMSMVGQIRVHNDDVKRIPVPNSIKRGMYDDEEAEPLTAQQAKEVLGLTYKQKTRALYNFMNDTGYRIAEAGMVRDSDFDLSATPPSVKTPDMSIKGVITRSVRFLRVSTASQIRALLTDNPENLTFRKSNSQTILAFRNAEYKKIKKTYDKLGMTQTYEDTGRRKYNLHSWRKRCSTEYARANGESMTDGYLRHSKYLAQYHQKTKDERIEAFKKAEKDLAIDESEKLRVRNKELENEKSLLEKKNFEISKIEKRLFQVNKDLEDALDKRHKQKIYGFYDESFVAQMHKEFDEQNKTIEELKNQIDVLRQISK